MIIAESNMRAIALFFILYSFGSICYAQTAVENKRKSSFVSCGAPVSVYALLFVEIGLFLHMICKNRHNVLDTYCHSHVNTILISFFALH